ncbi:MAG: type II toxin-antitoxin system YoeB family toxin [Symploca sp. SIO2E6]|nr:type II toxin-antitoxin system YoeB family toxin [Symploca sp. SIO2E6]
MWLQENDRKLLKRVNLLVRDIIRAAPLGFVIKPTGAESKTITLLIFV